MAVARPAVALEPRRFGRKPTLRGKAPLIRARALNDDLRLFAITFAAGFLFVSVVIA
jgi:hypothetical protein